MHAAVGKIDEYTRGLLESTTRGAALLRPCLFLMRLPACGLGRSSGAVSCGHLVSVHT